MPVIITKNEKDYYLVPAPLVSFSKQNLNNIGRPGLGAEYSITLQGQLIATHGNPYYISPLSSGQGGIAGLSEESWTHTPVVEENEIKKVEEYDRLNSIIQKQNLIRYLFSNPVESGGQAKPICVQVVGFPEGSNTGLSPGISFCGFVDDISFDSDGRWNNPCSYTINMRANSFIEYSSSGAMGYFPNYYNENVHSGFMISSLTENIDLQEDGRTSIYWTNHNSGRKFFQPQSFAKIFTINRSVTAIGSPVYDESGHYYSGLAPWQHASGYIYSYLGVGSGVTFPDQSGIFYTYGLSGLINGSNSGWRIGNFSYQESIDKEAGSYSLNESYTVFSGGHPIIETVNINHDIGENGVNAISVQGTIEGLNTTSLVATGDAYFNANSYFTGVIDTGISALNQYVITQPYLYARGILQESSKINMKWLHPVPLSRSIARDMNKGTISYTYNFDDRIPNIIPGSISESIQINDTYPGELFSVTPVIGRSQPVLQYLNSRSEYKRTLSINVTMGRNTGIYSYFDKEGTINNTGYLTSNQVVFLKKHLLDYKPSITNVDELNYIFQAANPYNDDNFNIAEGKCYHSPPTETWDPKTGNYSYNIEWTYERI